METRKSNTRIIVVSLVLLLLIAAFAAVYFLSRQAPVKGDKHITVEVVYDDKSTDTLGIDTDAEYLLAALDGYVKVEGETGMYGYFVTSVNGVVADSAKNQFWMVYVDGIYSNYAIDKTPVSGGETFRLIIEQY